LCRGKFGGCPRTYKDEFLDVLHEAASIGFACIGGQFQWVLPGGTCEPFWLNVDSNPHHRGESWASYVERAEAEVKGGYELLLRTTDFNAEADKWEFLREQKENGISLDDCLIFIAYFSCKRADV